MQIIVLGMHRSGTSALSSVLNAMGAYFGEDSVNIGANQENPKGFWERRDIRELNDFLLSSMHCDWDNISNFDLKKLPDTTILEFENRAKEILGELEQYPISFIKEPRICLLLPLWQKLLVNPIFILIYRNPLEIAFSLFERNNITIPVGLALWEKYCTSILNNTTGLPRILVSYSDLVTSPVESTTKLYQELTHLGASLDPIDSTSIEYILPSSLRRQTTSLNPSAYLTNYQLKLHNHFKSIDQAVNTSWHEVSEFCELILKEYDNNVLIRENQRLHNNIHELNKLVMAKQEIINSASPENITSLKLRYKNNVNHLNQRLALVSSFQESHKRSLEETAAKFNKYKVQDQRQQKIIEVLTEDNTQLRRYARQSIKLINTIFSSKRWKISGMLSNVKNLVARRGDTGLAEKALFNIEKEYSHLLRPSPYLTKHSAHYYERDNASFPSIDIIVCVHDAIEDTRACLNSVEANTVMPFKLIIVNDGSSQQTTEYLTSFSEKRPYVTLINNTQAKGYTKAANQGLKSSSAEYIVCLNSDTIVPRLWIYAIIECFQSDSRIGIVGPLSNAASWQSVPERFAKNGDWAVNPIPNGHDINQIGELVYRLSEKAFPKVAFINGFCFAIKRSVIRSIGYLDEANFPEGYGEENDYCLRASNAGFILSIADQCYVYHSKSKSYSHNRRKALSEKGSNSLKSKHGSEIITEGTNDLRNNRDLDKIRKKLNAYLKLSGPKIQVSDELSILFVMPVKGGSGGAHSVVQEVSGMRLLGVNAKVATLKKYTSGFQSNYPSLFDSGDHFLFFETENDLYDASIEFDIIVATLWSSPAMIKPIVRRNPNIIPAYYIQDYEPWFFENDSKERVIAHQSYTCIPNIVLFAKTDWLCNIVKSKHGKGVYKVSPSLDTEVYYPPRKSNSNKLKVHQRPVKIVAMVRPSTPRRAAWTTLKLLRLAKINYGKDIIISIFGCNKEDLKEFYRVEKPDFSLDFDYQNLGLLVREQVAELLRDSDIFVDFSDYQAFGRTGLEAMACGCAVVLPIKGGTEEYGENRRNCLMVDTSSLDQMYSALKEFLDDESLRESCRNNAIKTAANYNVQRSALSELSLFRYIKAKRQHSETTKRWPNNFKSQKSLVSVWPCRIKTSDIPTGSAYIRLLQPFQHKSIENKADVTLISDFNELVSIQTDILIIQRSAVNDYKLAIRVLDYCKENHIKVVFEIDDDLFTLSEDQSDNSDSEQILALEVIARRSDCITTSSYLLRERLLKKNKKCVSISNSIDFNLWSSHPSVTEGDTEKKALKILYMGTRTHHNDLQLVKEALIEIKEEFKDKVSIEVIGVTEDIESLGFVTSTTVPINLSYPEFVKWLVNKGPWDIGLIPLQDTFFNRTKSFVKFLDYTAMNLAIVCSNVPSYQEIAINRHNCLLCDETTESWRSNIRLLLNDPALRQKLTKNAADVARRQFTMEHTAASWLEVFNLLT